VRPKVNRRAVSTPELPTPEAAALFLVAGARATEGTTLFVDGRVVALGPPSDPPSAQARR